MATSYDTGLEKFLLNSRLSDLGVIYRNARIVYLDSQRARSSDIIRDLRARRRAARRVRACRPDTASLEAQLVDEALLIAETTSYCGDVTAAGMPF